MPWHFGAMARAVPPSSPSRPRAATLKAGSHCASATPKPGMEGASAWIRAIFSLTEEQSGKECNVCKSFWHFSLLVSQ